MHPKFMLPESYQYIIYALASGAGEVT